MIVAGKKHSRRPERFRLNGASRLYRGLVFAGLGRHPATDLYHDLAPGSRHGVLTGFTGAGNTPAARWAWDSTLGRQALSFNGTTDYVSISRTFGIFSGSGPYSVAALVKLASVGAFSQMIFHPRAEYDVSLRVNSSGYFEFSFYDGAASVGPNSGATPTASIWYALAGVFDKGAGLVRLYLNGLPAASPVAIAGSASARTDLNTIGTQYYSATTNNSLNGSLADVMIWERALDQSEALALADVGNTGLAVAGVPLVVPARRFWPAAPAAGGGGDVTPPTVDGAATSITTAGNILTITFIETGSAPVLPASGVTGFTLNLNGGPVSITGTSISGTTGTFNLSRKALAIETATLDYDSVTGNVTDSSSNPMSTFVGTSITNNSTATTADLTGTGGMIMSRVRTGF